MLFLSNTFAAILLNNKTALYVTFDSMFEVGLPKGGFKPWVRRHGNPAAWGRDGGAHSVSSGFHMDAVSAEPPGGSPAVREGVRVQQRAAIRMLLHLILFQGVLRSGTIT